ncbi:hypothetical protein PR003_g21812 [Phytophthora rubi]|uniref:C2H2-type domain-containing protein n=1 Tax=Phytophthora rubi TaxID=129364 RepID=A0A6A4DAW4_9STRA|nr:hypothetical protein PR003_g21812 [Phytophthora rubi]
MSTALAAARAKTKGKRMLRNALDAYGAEDRSLSKWNARKKRALEEGKWVWKESVVNANAAIKARFDKEEVQTSLKARFVDIQAAMEEEMSSAIHVDQHGGQLLGPNHPNDSQCCWRERIGGKMHHCTNVLPVENKKRTGLQEAPPTATVAACKRFCLWHAKECGYEDHPMERSRAIEIPNELGMCLHCYEATAGTVRATLQKVPPRIGALKVPGACKTNARKELKRDAMLRLRGAKSSLDAETGRKLGPTSVCAWQREHSEINYMWRCSNRVLMHPVLRGSYLPFCGFHAPRCIQEYGNKGNKEQACPLIDRKNRYGMCRNHLEAHLSTLSFEERGGVLLIDSDFDVPGIKECRKEEVVVPLVRHPLAPKYPPPALDPNNGLNLPMETTHAVVVLPSRLPRSPLEKIVKKVRVLVETVIREVLNHPNPVSVVAKEVLWRVQFLRRAEVVATRIQRIFRGNRARRRVRLLLYEQAAMDRMKACRVLQRFVRGFLGRRRFEHEHENVHKAVPHIQRLLRGALARKHFRELLAAIRLQRNYRWYRQRILARGFREEIAYMQALQRQADANYLEMEKQMNTFRRLRARRVLHAHIVRWKRRQEMHQQEVAERLRSLLGTVKIQRQWRRHHRYMIIKKRYGSAQRIQKRVRGWLTRHMWLGDPGLHFVTHFVSARSGFQYGKVVLEPQPSKSYSYPSWKVRTRFGALAIQRVFRGHLGRLSANARWAAMLKRWEWLGITPTDSSGQLSDAMTVGHQRYGFVLPSFAYHEDRRQHMRPTANEPVPNRGHAYKYQYILDLISDRDGKRGWSLAKEEMYKRQLREEQEWLRAEEDRPEQEAAVHPMPERAQVIEERMMKLGFQHDSKANVYQDSPKPEEEAAIANDPTRPETTPVHTKSALGPGKMSTVDDMMLFREVPTPPNSQDMQRLIYELKTLPREARREQIIHIASQRAHAYVCGHPACGKCFSSRKVARLHQSTSHEGRERLASVNPQVDQYLHSYWPQGAPWTEAERKRMVGYFGCSRAGCEKLQFRSQRELNRHHHREHGIDDDYESGSSCPTSSPPSVLSEEVVSTKRSTTSRRAIWLGAYVVCRSLEAKLGIAPAALTNPKPCSVHDKPVQLCTACFLHQLRPAFPFRLYSAMAVRKQVDTGNGPLRIEAETPPGASEDEEFMVFRDDDDEFCPAVNIWGVYSLGAPPKRKEKDKVILPGGPLSSVLYLKVSTICRDAVGEAWMFGHVLAHRKRAGAKVVGQDGDENEVVPDKARGLVFALLSQIVGSASSSKNVFYRKYVSRAGDSGDVISSSSTTATATSTGKKGNALARNLFCRPSHTPETSHQRQDED